MVRRLASQVIRYLPFRWVPRVAAVRVDVGELALSSQKLGIVSHRSLHRRASLSRISREEMCERGHGMQHAKVRCNLEATLEFSQSLVVSASEVEAPDGLKTAQYVVTEAKLTTGQNPASSEPAAKALLGLVA